MPLGLCVALWLGAGLAVAQEPAAAAEEEVDHIGLASVLVRDGHYDRAAAVLGGVDPGQEGLDVAQYWMLKGLIEVKRESWGDAQRFLEQALKAGKQEPSVHTLLARASFANEDWEATLKALDGAGAYANDKPGAWLMRSRSHDRLGHVEGAWEALTEGRARFPDNLDIAREKLTLMIRLGLFQEAVAEGDRFLEAFGDRVEGYVMIAEALIQGNSASDAVLVLEEALLRFPESERVMVQLGRAYLGAGKPLAAGTIFQKATALNPALALDAAELYRQAGDLERAMAMNAQVHDQKSKIRQRLGLLIEQNRMEEAAALEPRLARLGLLEEQGLIYALAYAYFKTGRFQQSERWLKRIEDPELFRKAIELRRVMERCKREGGCD
ncbi:MAG: hypothetical protein CMH57_14000 [Myxococcales bacterium]|nr:hypothetical protein [Myxococcales bacterium]